MDKYRVIVIRESDTAPDETLFEVAGSAGRVARLAPGALIDVLTEDAADADQLAAVQSAQPAAVAASVADRVFDDAVAAGNAATEQAAGHLAPPPAKRPRRTKAQIAADTEAQGLGYRDAAHRTETEAQQAVAAGVTASPVAADYVPPPGEVVAGSVPGPVVTEEPVPAASPAAAPVPPGTPGGQPWNPFTQ